MTQMTSPLQAFLTGAIVGSLLKAKPLEIDAEMLVENGNYLPEILVTAKNSDEVIRVKVEVETPEERFQRNHENETYGEKKT